MKTLHLVIITAIGIVAVITSGIFLLNYESVKPTCIEGRLPNGTCAGPVAMDLVLTNLDLLHATTENPLGIKAQVIVEPDTTISCIKKCDIPPTPHLVLSSERGAQFVDYQVCDGISCKKDNLDNSLYVHLNHVPQNYSGAVSLETSHINLGDLSWNLGDSVHVIVKAFPVTLHPDSVVTRESEKTTVVDLGKSKIGGCSDPEQGNLSHDVESFTKRLQVENLVLRDTILKKFTDDSYCEFMSTSTVYTENGTYQVININLNDTKNLVAQVSLQ